jgi:hypothetical protein
MKTYAPNKVVNELMGRTDIATNDRCCGESGTFAATRPDIATQVRFRKEEEMRKGAEKARAGRAAPGEDPHRVSVVPAGIVALRRRLGTTADYIVVEMARHILGENWMPDSSRAPTAAASSACCCRSTAARSHEIAAARLRTAFCRCLAPAALRSPRAPLRPAARRPCGARREAPPRTWTSAQVRVPNRERGRRAWR